MPLFNTFGNEINDEWVYVKDDESIPAFRSVIVSLERWRKDREMLTTLQKGVGVVLAADELVGEVIGDLDNLNLIQVTFPSFADGRAYSTARLLRDRFGFKGEIRAGGDVLLDQLQAMQRCGIDSYVINNEPTIRWTRKGHRPTVDLFYQPALDTTPTIQVLRNTVLPEPARLAS